MDLTPTDAKTIFFYVLEKLMINEIEPKFFKENSIIQIFSIIKEFYKINKTIPNATIIKNEIQKKNYTISDNVLNELLNYKTTYETIKEQIGEQYIKGICDKNYKRYIFEVDIHKHIDVVRDSTTTGTTINTIIDDYIEKNILINPFEKNTIIRTDEYGRIDYSQYSDTEIKDFNYNLSKMKIENAIDIFSSRFDPNIKYPDKKYILYPLVKEGQLGIIFGKSGEGKSIFAMEIANFIAKGKSDWDFFRVDTDPQKVLYINFELSQSSLANRYKANKFSNDLTILTMLNYEYNNFLQYGQKNEVRLNKSLDTIEQLALKYDTKIIFIDNLSNIADSVEQASEADRFISDLYGRMKAKNITIIFLGHTPKVSNSSAITQNQLKGSSSLSKTFEVMIGFQRSNNDKNISHIKQVKTRDVDNIFDELNVAKFQYNSNGIYGWELEYIGNDTESNLVDDRQNNSGRPQKYDNKIKIDVLYDLYINKKNVKDIQMDYSINRTTYYNFIEDYKLNKDSLKDEYELYINEKDKNIFGEKNK